MGNGTHAAPYIVGNLLGTPSDKNGDDKGKITLQNLSHSPQTKFNLFSISIML